MKKVLMIAYYFPPLGGGGVQRPLKFAKYLPVSGWQPHVLTVKKADYYAYDSTLLEELCPMVKIHQTYACELDKIFKFLVKLNSRFCMVLEKFLSRESKIYKGCKYLPHRLFLWLNNVVLFPDNQIGWLPFAVLRGKRIVEKEKIDLIYSSSPPVTAHVIGWILKVLTGKPWVADWRDDWTHEKEVRFPSRLHKKIAEHIEKRFFALADYTCTVTESIRQRFLNAYPHIRKDKFIVVTNGYDPENFAGPLEPSVEGGFVVVHAGLLHGGSSPGPFLEAVARLVEQDSSIKKEMRIVFVGQFAEEHGAIVEAMGLGEMVELPGYLPHHEALRRLRRADVLLLIISRERPHAISGKIFEYLAAEKPILALVPEGEASKLIRKARAGVVVPPDDTQEIQRALAVLYSEHKKGRLKIEQDRSVVKKFDRKKLAAELARVFESISGGEKG